MATIAKNLGLTCAAVSYALRELPGVNEQTRRRVLREAKRLGYRPNAAARAVAKGDGKCGAIALVLCAENTRSTSPIGTAFIEGIHDALDKYDLRLLTCRVPIERLTSSDYVPQILRELSTDGLLINYAVNVPPRLDQLLEHYSVPAVWINVKRRYDSVYPDEVAIAAAITKRLLAAGHRRVAYVTPGDKPPPGGSIHFSVIDRRQGYVMAMKESGLEPLIASAAWSRERIPPSLRQWLRTHAMPTAVVCYPGLCQTQWLSACWEMGVRMPTDFRLETFPAEPEAGGAPYVPFRELGRQSVEMLMKKIDNPRLRLRSRAVAVPKKSAAPSDRKKTEKGQGSCRRAIGR